MNWLLRTPKTTLLFWFLGLFFGLEAINKIQEHFFAWDFDLQKYSKVFCLLLILLYMLFKERKKIVFLSILVLFFVIGNYFLPQGFTKLSVAGFGRYFLFLTIILFFKNFSDSGSTIPRIFSLYQNLLWLNNGLILLALVFNIEIFKTYEGGRWGYNGLFMASATSTYFYLIALIFFLVYYKESYFKKTIFWFTLLAALCVGTKSLYLSILLIGAIALFQLKIASKAKVFLLGIMVFAGAFGLFMFFNSSMFSAIIKEDGIMSAILSYRNNLWIEKTLPYIQGNWNTIHYFIGGLSNPLVRPQLELLDLFLYFGIIGTTFYLYVFFKNYFNFAIDNSQKALFGILFLIPLLSGNFFYNASVPIYLIILKLSCLNQQGN